jgi:hypothetical protein
MAFSIHKTIKNYGNIDVINNKNTDVNNLVN